MVLKKAQLRLARKIWVIQKRHPKVRFMPEHFTGTGKLTKRGRIAIIKRKK